MTTVLEIREAISRLSERERNLLSAELFAVVEPDQSALEKSLTKGLEDIKEGRVRPIARVREEISSWVSRS